MPVFSDSSSSYLETIEIETIMSVLKIIDNPMQDIPLITVLRSPIGGFDDNELLEIRIGCKKESYYESMLKYIENEENDNELIKKIKMFLSVVDTWREKEEYLPLEELIWQIYLDTGYYNYVSLMPNGASRKANLKMLFERAKQYESSSFKGLFNFISFIEKLKIGSGDMSAAKLIGENEDVIRIMSIHKSKGLEFPVVFLAGTGKKFNFQDLNDMIVLHQDLGFGPKYKNEELKIEYSTLAKEAVKPKVKNETISEEMRILYVALTRAKEKLIITGITKDYEKEIKQKKEKIKTNQNKEKIESVLIKHSTSYLDWLENVYLFNEDKINKYIKLNIYQKQDIINKTKEEKKQEKENIIEKMLIHNEKKGNLQEILEKLEWEYKNIKSSQIPSKTSVTKIKEMVQGNEKQITNWEIPKFMKQHQKISNAQKGTLVHLCMQYLNEKEEYTLQKVKELVNSLQEINRITKEEAEVINIQKVFNFTKSKIWEKMKKAKKVYKEEPFYYLISAKEIYGEEIEENILVQGIIDLYFINQDETITLVDYKTDYVEKEEELIEKYDKQLEIYKKAIEEATGKKVTEVYIYSTYLNKEIMF